MHRYESGEDAKRALISMDGMSIDGLTHGSRKLKVKPFVAPAKKHSDWGNVAKRFPVRACTVQCSLRHSQRAPGQHKTQDRIGQDRA